MAKNKCGVILLLGMALVLGGCGGDKGMEGGVEADENKPLSEVEAEAASMNVMICGPRP